MVIVSTPSLITSAPAPAPARVPLSVSISAPASMAIPAFFFLSSPISAMASVSMSSSLPPTLSTSTSAHNMSIARTPAMVIVSTPSLITSAPAPVSTSTSTHIFIPENFPFKTYSTLYIIKGNFMSFNTLDLIPAVASFNGTFSDLTPDLNIAFI